MGVPIKLSDLLKAPAPTFGGINTRVGGTTTPAALFNGAPATAFAPPPAAIPAPVAPAAPVAPVVPVTPATPIVQKGPVAPVGATGATGSAPPAQSPVNPQYLNTDGSFKDPTQIASEVGASLKAAHGNGDVGTLAAEQFAGGDKSAVQLEADARRIGNTRNDIAVGEKDPYKVGADSGIAYTPAELSAIEKAYAGVYDPALDTALAKVTAKQASDKTAADQASQLAQIKAQGDETRKTQAAAPYTLGQNDVRYGADGQPIAVGAGSGDSGVYTPGANPTVDAYVKGFQAGTYKASDIPDAYKALVAQGVAQASADGAPLSKTSIDAIGIINQLQTLDLNPLSGTGFVGAIEHPSSLFPGTAVQKTQNLAKQLQAIISLGNRQQLKGSGAISDFEFRVLQDGATALGLDDNGRTNLSPDDFKNELAKLELKLQVGQTSLTDDEVQYLNDQGYTPDQIRSYSQQQSFSSVGNTTASTGKNIPQKNNNPGDIKAGGLADALAVGKDKYGHLIFPDEATGFKALTADLTAKIHGTARLPNNPTIEQLGKVYAEDPNWPKKVASILGVTPDTHTQVVPIDKLVHAVATQEGFYA